MKRAHLLHCIIAILLISCSQPDMKISLTEIISLDNIPGASGIGSNDKHIVIIGDNSPYLYLLDHDTKPLGIIPIYPLDNVENGEIPKKIKPDFEALELLKGETHEEIFIFGSGSRSPQRDIFIHVTLSTEPKVKTYSLVSFYDQLRKMDIMNNFELNIEAVAIHENKLLLLNRGKNLIFTYDYRDFLRFLNEEIPYPQPIVNELNLPQINGFISGFSGATVIPGTSTLLFTTSVEDTPNAYDDGKVLGSYIGMVDLNHFDNSLKYQLVKDEEQKPLKIKIESVSIFNQISPNELELLMVTDSDGDESLLLRALLTW